MDNTLAAGKRLLSVLVLAVLLSGCATAAQRQYQAMAAGNRAAGQEAYACVTAVYNAAEFAPLRAHVALPPDRPTLEQLSDGSLATDGEIRALLAVHPRVQDCRQQALDHLTQSTPSFAAILATLYAKSEDNLIELIDKKESWGEYTRQTRDLAIEGRSDLTAEAERITSGLQQSHEAELAQRQAAAQSAADAFARYAQTQQIISAMNRSSNTVMPLPQAPQWQPTPTPKWAPGLEPPAILPPLGTSSCKPFYTCDASGRNCDWQQVCR